MLTFRIVFPVKHPPETKNDFRSDEERSIKPSELIFERRASNVNFSLIRPELTPTVFFIVPNDPPEVLYSADASLLMVVVWRFIVAPKAAAPLVELPMPRCT